VPELRRLISYGLLLCPHCRKEIDPQYALVSAPKLVVNTQACSLANTIKRGEPAVVIILAATVSIFATNGSSPLLAGFLTPAIYIMAIVFWLLRYRRFTAGDEQFRRSRKDLIKSLKLWSALLFVQILLLGYFVKVRS
jgi:hypothetical protein